MRLMLVDRILDNDINSGYQSPSNLVTACLAMMVV